MSFNIDIAIVIGFLLVTLVVGMYKGQNIQNIKEFALGNRNFTTVTLVCTIVATWIGGEDFFILISESYTDGLYFILAYSFGILAVILLIGLFFAPRMGEFLGDLSIASAMGRMYGNNVKLITAVAGSIATAGMIAAQFKISGMLFEYTLGISSVYGIVIGASIVTMYSAFGGIKSVSFTDVIQFFMFGAILPTLVLFILGTLDNSNIVIDTISVNNNFDFSQVFDFTSSKSLYYLFIFFWVAVPSFDPAIFQRISMAKDTMQARKSFIISAFVFFSLSLIMSWIGVIALAIYPDVAAEEIAKHIILDYSYSGLKGLTIAGILAMMMSTADSYINSTSVLFTHDFCSAAGIKIKNELIVSRMIALILGVFSFVLALYSDNLLKLIITTKSFYMPLVSVPFIFSIIGFRSSAKSVLIGMLAGFITVVLWEIFLRESTVDSVIPGMAVNIIFLFSSHYILKQSGGWVGIKDYSTVIQLRRKRKEQFRRYVDLVKEFNLIDLCKDTSPKEDVVYLHFGIFSIFSTYFAILTMPEVAQANYKGIIDFIYPSVFFLATALISYPIWFKSLRKSNLISIIWTFSLFYILICIGSMHVLTSNFSKFQLMTFMLNFIVLAVLVRWPIALLMMVIGTFSSIQFFKFYTGDEIFSGDFSDLQFTIAYLLLFMSTILIIFLKPKQEYQEATEAKVDILEEEVIHLETEVADLNEKVVHYTERVEDQSREIERLGATAQRILNNVNHELRLPVGNVMNFAEMLNDGLGKFNEDQLKDLSDEVYKNSNRLSSMILNMLDLATLDVKKIELNKIMINFGELVRDRVQSCRKIYLGDKQLDFEMQIEDNIFISVDPNYMRQTVDNLVINAINFSTKGAIRISVLRRGSVVEFMISDNGIGIPKEDLYDIFTPFKMGSNSESKAEGRGVGLALCKSAVEAHGGSISAESKDGVGAQFRFVL